MKLMIRITMNTALISFAVYEKAEWIRKINTKGRVQKNPIESVSMLIPGTLTCGCIKVHGGVPIVLCLFDDPL